MTYGRTHLKTVNHSYCEGPPYSNYTGNREPVITIVMVANTKYYWSHQAGLGRHWYNFSILHFMARVIAHKPVINLIRVRTKFLTLKK